MNKLHEISRIQSILKIPISDVNFESTYVDIISDVKKIGSIPFYSVAGIITYDDSPDIVNNLNWFDVYNQHKSEIDNLIKELFKSDNISILLGVFRSFYIRNDEGELLGKIICTYDSNWHVMLT